MKNEETLQKQTDKKKPSRRKYIITAGILLLLIIPVLIFILLLQNQKPDPASEKIIREVVAKQLNKEPNDLTDEDFAKVESFVLAKQKPESPLKIFLTIELSDIKALEKFTNLKTFGMNSVCCPENDIPKWMTLMAKVGLFNIEERLALDLRPLEKLHTLETLSIVDTPVKDIKPIANLIKLRVLNLHKTQTINIKILKNLINLKELDISRNPITNFEAIKKLENLQWLYIRGCENITEQQVEDLQKALPNLKIIGKSTIKR